MIMMITDTHDNNICAQKLNLNRTFFNQCTISWTLAFKSYSELGNLFSLKEQFKEKGRHVASEGIYCSDERRKVILTL